MKSFLRWIVCAGVFQLAIGCSSGGLSAGNSEAEKENKMDSDSEIVLVPVGSPVVTGNTLAFDVVSFGCTQATDFLVETRVAENQCKVRIIRQKQDFCKAAPEKMSIRFDWNPPAECDGLDVVFENPELQ